MSNLSFRLNYQGQDAWHTLNEMSIRYRPAAVLDVPLEATQQQASHMQSSTFSMRELIHELQASEDYRDQIVPDGHRSLPEHLAQYGTVALPPATHSRRTIQAFVCRTQRGSHPGQRHFPNV